MRPVTRRIIQCRYSSFALSSFQSKKLRRNISNYDPGHQLPQHFPQQSPGIPQYFPQQPSPTPQYIPQHFPQTFPEQPPAQEPKALKKWGRYGGIIAALICAAFVGQCIHRNPDQRLCFDLYRAEGLMGKDRRENILSWVGKAEFGGYQGKIYQWSKKKHLGELHVALTASDEKTSQPSQPGPQKPEIPLLPHQIDSIKNLSNVLIRVWSVIPPMRERRRVGYFGFWYSPSKLLLIRSVPATN